jgi:eukaryotic-like serine/threonine-protein kinase
MPMTPVEWSAVKEILNGALECSPADRPAYLEQACGDDGELRRRIESLIEADAQSWSLMEAPAAASSSLKAATRLPTSGERIGAYEILREIGHGGMGVVYLARRSDDQFEKNVAIKLALVGLAGDSLERRFRAERQIVASLDHPNIARLLDGGTTAEGRPFLVMEYVEGQPLGLWCDTRKLSTRERLEIFLEVCAAVQYAHQHLVVHRDLKPANILVTEQGNVKLLDFGIAKLIAPDLSGDATERTGTLFRLLTPDYASPEQVRGGPISTVSDVYALGVVLYELLTGEKPYRVTDSSPAEMLWIICEREPAKPSTVAKPPASKALAGDLDTIILTALRKEPARRYASVGAFARDIRRHLGGLPVEARTDSFGYRTGKFIQRHRAAVAATVLVVAALAGGLIMTLREARRARTAEASAERRFNDVRRLANSFLFEIHDQIKDLPGSTPARQLLVKRALEYLDSLAKERSDEPALARELAAAYQKVGDVQGNPYQPNLGDLSGGLTSYRKAIDLLVSLTDRSGAVAEDRSALAGTYLAGCGMPLVMGDTSAAVEMSRKGLALRQALVQESPKDAKRKRDLSTALRIHAYNLSIAGRHPEASDALRQQAAILRELLAEAPEDPELRGDLGQNRYVTGIALKEVGDRPAARGALLEAEDLQRSLMVANPNSGTMRRSLFWSLTDAANLFLESNELGLSRERYQEALEIAQSLSRADPTSRDGQVLVAVAHVNLGELHGRLGQAGAARRHRTDARAVLEALVKADPSNLWVAGILADLYIVLARDRARSVSGGHSLESSCDLYRQGLALFERLKAKGRLPPGREPAMQKARDGLKTCPEERAAASLR